MLNTDMRIAQACIFPLCAVLLAGCVGLNSLPHVARGGDTVVLAVGSPEGMTKSNITVSYVPDSDPLNPVDLTGNIRALFNLYPDPTSAVALGASAGIGTIYGKGHEPWLTSLAIDLQYPMTVGTGTLNIDCVPKSSCTYPVLHPHINDVGIGLEIVPGMGEPNPFLYKGSFGGTFTALPGLLERLPQVTILPGLGGSSGAEIYGAATFVFNVPVETDTGGAVPDSDIFIIAEDITFATKSQRQLTWTRSGDNITVMMVTVHGMTYKEFRFSIVLKPPLAGSTIGSHVYTATPGLVSEVYYDLNGNVISGAASPQVNVTLNN